MRFALAAFGVAALVGAGIVIGKKILDEKRRENEEEFYDLNDFDVDEDNGDDVSAFAKESTSEKCGKTIRKASMFAVGAIKTGADKLGEAVEDIKSKDMVKKGEQTVGAVKETGGNIKNDIKRDIEDLKGMVSSIQDEEKSASSDNGEDLFDSAAAAVKDVASEVEAEVKDLFSSDDNGKKK